MTRIKQIHVLAICLSLSMPQLVEASPGIKQRLKTATEHVKKKVAKKIQKAHTAIKEFDIKEAGSNAKQKIKKAFKEHVTTPIKKAKEAKEEAKINKHVARVNDQVANGATFDKLHQENTNQWANSKISYKERKRVERAIYRVQYPPNPLPAKQAPPNPGNSNQRQAWNSSVAPTHPAPVKPAPPSERTTLWNRSSAGLETHALPKRPPPAYPVTAIAARPALSPPPFPVRAAPNSAGRPSSQNSRPLLVPPPRPLPPPPAHPMGAQNSAEQAMAKNSVARPSADHPPLIPPKPPGLQNPAGSVATKSSLAARPGSYVQAVGDNHAKVASTHAPPPPTPPRRLPPPAFPPTSAPLAQPAAKPAVSGPFDLAKAPVISLEEKGGFINAGAFKDVHHRVQTEAHIAKHGSEVYQIPKPYLAGSEKERLALKEAETIETLGKNLGESKYLAIPKVYRADKPWAGDRAPTSVPIFVDKNYELGSGFTYIHGMPAANGRPATAGKPLTSKELGQVMTDVTKGVQHMHGVGIVHRDLKADNLLLYKDANGRTRAAVSDFGLSRSVDSASSRAGSPGFMDPYPAKFEPKDEVLYRKKADTYGLGMTYVDLNPGLFSKIGVAHPAHCKDAICHEAEARKNYDAADKHFKNNCNPPKPAEVENCGTVALVRDTIHPEWQKRPTTEELVGGYTREGVEVQGLSKVYRDSAD